MTDDLANQLRQRASKQLAATPVSLLEKAADRIEELEAERDVVADLLKQRDYRIEELVSMYDALAEKLAKAVDGLKECVDEIDAYIQFEYPSDHPVHERYRQRDYAANPARIALAAIKEKTDGHTD